MKISQLTISLFIALVLASPSLLFAQEEEVISATKGSWETHIGFGVSIGASGLPSQVSNKLAQKEGFLADVGSMRGLPLGANFFTGFGYRFGETNHSMGFELGLGFHNDGGAARVTLGDDPANIPGYVFDGAYGALGGSFLMLMAAPGIQQMYPGLSTVNTMKGQYLDPKLRIYYRYRKPTWNIQTGLGLNILIPLNYFAYPSKHLSDYRAKNQASFEEAWFTATVQGPVTAARIPFPLKTRDGKVMMRAFQPLLDLHVRAAYRNYYLEVSYSTEFHYIHHLKIGLGIQFM